WIELAQALPQGIVGLAQKLRQVTTDAAQTTAFGQDNAQRPQGKQGHDDGGQAVQAAGQFFGPLVELGMARHGKPPQSQELVVQLQHSEWTCLASFRPCGSTSTSDIGPLGPELYP